MPSAGRANCDVEETLQEEELSRSGERGQVKVRARDMICEECCEQESKYRCPGCGFRTCGVKCVKSHKERTKCDGKRKRTEFVNINEYDDNWFISDYNLLEETLRQADSAKRLRAPLSSRRKEDLTPQQKALKNQAKARSTTLLFVAHGMTKRTANTSFFEKRSKRIFWRVEWVFEGTDVRFVDSRMDENLALGTVLAKHLAHDSGSVSARHRVRNFRGKLSHELILLLLKEPCSAADKEYFELSSGDCLKNQLADKSIIEYPTIHVLLSSSLGGFASSKIARALPAEVEQQVQNKVAMVQDPHGMEGVPFREEEFEEGEVVEDGEIIA